MNRRVANGVALLFLSLMLTQGAHASSAGDIWRPSAESGREGPGSSDRGHQLDAGVLDRLLAKAPLERTTEAKSTSVILTLPMPDGAFQRFRIEESPVMEPILAAKFPEIRTYRGTGLDDPAASARLLRTGAGFEAQILSSRSVILVEPTSEPGFYKSSPWKAAPFWCGTTGEQVTLPGRVHKEGDPAAPAATGESIRKYRLAVATTADFTALTGGSKQTAMNFIAGYVNRLNGVYERDLTVHFDVINNNDQLINLTKPDGYTDSNANALLDENQAKIDAVIGTANYDLGMVFAKSEPGSGNGVAQLQSVCSPTGKYRNAQRIPATDPSWDSVAFHETAHQFGANHTYNSVVGPCGDQRSAETAWEPGGGTTIMSYATVCDNIQDREDLYFHGGSIAEMNAFIATATCTQSSPSSGSPNVSIPNGPFGIPKGTPFALTAAGSSAGGTLTFCWEELDTGTASQGMPDLDDGSRPIFRSFLPAASPTRVFPQMSDILSGTSTKGESLPAANRTMKFRVTARDNKAGGGGVNAADTTVTVNGAAGPFTVTAPAAGATLTPGSAQTVTWTVAATDTAPLSVANVKISLSNDGGTTFPTVLAESVPNTGSATVNLPAGNNLDGRVKVEAVGGIFFNISPQFFARPQCPAITLSPAALPDGQVLYAYGPITLAPTGGTPPYTFKVTSGTLPWAVTLSADGVLSGPPQEGGSANFTVTVADSLQCTGSAAYTINSVPAANIGDAGETVETGGRKALAIVPMSFPVSLSAPSPVPVTIHYETFDETAEAGEDYTATSGTLTFAPGETSKEIEVLVNGTPDGEISESFQVILSDPHGVLIEDGIGEGEILEAEAGSCPAMTVTPPSLANGKRGVAYSQTISVTGGAAFKDVSLFDGRLPEGLSLAESTGVLSGTPRVSGTFNFSVEVLDASFCYEGKAFTLVIDEPAPVITSHSPASGAAGTMVTITGSGLLSASKVTFGNGLSVTLASVTDTTLRFSVPAGAVSGKLTVTTSNGTATSPSVFTVVNVKPVALNGSLATTTGTLIKGRLVASDSDGGTLAYSIYQGEKTGSGNGTVVVTNAATGDFTYTPKAGFSGTDKFYFQVYDGKDISNTATVTVTVTDPSKLLLQRGRVTVLVTWRSQYNGQTGTAVPLPQKDEFGFFYFTDPNNPEVFVKVLDFGSGKALCFVGGLSDFEYTVTFTSVATGQTLQFKKEAGKLNGFAASSLPYSGADTVPQLIAVPLSGETDQRPDSPVMVARKVAYGVLPISALSLSSPSYPEPGATQSLSLSKGRITLTVDWKSQYSGQTGRAFAIPQKDEFGFLYFTDPNNPEVFAKVLDFDSGYAIIFITSLSDFEYTATFTNQKGEKFVFTKPAGSLDGGASNKDLKF